MPENNTEKQIKKQLPEGMTPWKPGESGNPNGRPKKGSALTDIMREYLDGEIDTNNGKSTRKEAFIRAVYSKAMKGGDAAQRLIFSHIDGMPQQSIGMNITNAEPIEFIDPEEKNI